MRRLGWLVEETQGSVTLYHGTLRSYLDAVLKTGIEVGEGWGGAGTSGAFLSGTVDGAIYWAKMAYQREHGERLEISKFDPANLKELAVVKVTIPADKTENLYADMEQADDVGFEGEESDWQASLKEIGDVRYDGTIPASWVRDASPAELTVTESVRRLEWLDEAKRPSRRRLAALDERGVDKAGQVNAQLAHCMLAVTTYRDVDTMGAWNICRWNLTKNGFLHPPYRENDKVANVRYTQKGTRRVLQHAQERFPLGGGIPGSPPAKFAKFRKLFREIEKRV